MNLTYLGDNIADLRKKAGLNKEELAEKLNVSRQAVSKWERNESYPETENLIAISKLFNVSLDDLVNTPQNGSTEVQTDNLKNSLNHSDNQDDITSNSNLNCKSNDNDEDDDDDDDDEEKDRQLEKEIDQAKKTGKLAFWMSLPYPVVITIIYLIWGFCTDNGWAIGWTLYITIPVYYTLLPAIKTGRMEAFCYPALVAFIYMFFGMLCDAWTPHWVIFLTIPLYYAIVPFISKKNK